MQYRAGARQTRDNRCHKQSSNLRHFEVNTFRAAWFQRFSQKKQQFSVALPTP